MSTTNVTNTCVAEVNNTADNNNDNNDNNSDNEKIPREFATAVCKMNLTKLISLMRIMNVLVTADKNRFNTTEQAVSHEICTPTKCVS